MFENTYREIEKPKRIVFKEKGSKFISYIFNVKSESEIKNKIKIIKRKEHSANHHCYAYILHPDKSAQKESDDGEPSSTAGKPILNQIKSNDLTNTLIIVVRYFGGTKLGIPGLIKAYKKAASQVISTCKIITKNIKEQYKVSFNYSQINNVMKIIKLFNLEIINKSLKTECSIIFTVKKDKADNVIKTYKENYHLKIEYIKTI